VVLIDKDKRRINRKMDRQHRANNPSNYQNNGTIKKGKRNGFTPIAIYILVQSTENGREGSKK